MNSLRLVFECLTPNSSRPGDSIKPQIESEEEQEETQTLITLLTKPIFIKKFQMTRIANEWTAGEVKSYN